MTRAAFQCWVGIVAVYTVEGVYLNTRLDSDGLFLSGDNDYTITFPPGGTPNVGAFWSVTMYGQDHNLVSNGINRYKLGTYPVGIMQTNGDASLTIYIQNDMPSPDKVSNWLPAPTGGFYLIMRNYIPGSNIVDQTWAPPPVLSVPEPAVLAAATVLALLGCRKSNAKAG